MRGSGFPPLARPLHFARGGVGQAAWGASRRAGDQSAGQMNRVDANQTPAGLGSFAPLGGGVLLQPRTCRRFIGVGAALRFALLHPIRGWDPVIVYDLAHRNNPTIMATKIRKNGFIRWSWSRTTLSFRSAL